MTHGGHSAHTTQLVEGRGAADVARELGMSVGAVYTARSRVLNRIKRTIEELQDD